MTTQNNELQDKRDELLMRGAENLSDTDLLGLILGSAELAGKVCHALPTLRDVSREDLSRIGSLDDFRIAQILALTEIATRINTKPLHSGQTIRCSADVLCAYKARLAGQKQESFIALALDSKNRVISEHQISKGTLTSTEVHPRELFRALIRNSAARTVVLHNHPSGDPSPSTLDTALCRKLRQAGELIGIPILDFIIIGAEGCTSFRDMGMLPEVK